MIMNDQTLHSLTTRLPSSLHPLLHHLRTHPTLSTTLLLALPLTILARRDYTSYLSLGPGGLPSNPLGWLASNILRLLSRNPLSTRLYHSPTLPYSNHAGYLPPTLPKRAGPRPRIGAHPVPQRQVEQTSPEDVRRALETRFRALAGKVGAWGGEVRRSVHEGGVEGVFVGEEGGRRNVVFGETRGEVAHLHERAGDGTGHVVLAPRDCLKVMEAGWGQRHGLDGVKVLKSIAGFTLPVHYIFTYAPRTMEEVDVVMEIVRAAFSFAAGREVKE